MTKTTNHNKIRQENPQETFEQKVVNDFRKLTRKQLLYILKIVELESKHGVVYPMQDTLGKMLGTHRQDVNYISTDVNEIGQVRKINRGTMKSCLYELDEVFYISSVRRLLGEYFSQFRTKSFRESTVYILGDLIIQSVLNDTRYNYLYKNFSSRGSSEPELASKTSPNCENCMDWGCEWCAPPPDDEIFANLASDAELLRLESEILAIAFDGI